PGQKDHDWSWYLSLCRPKASVRGRRRQRKWCEEIRRNLLGEKNGEILMMKVLRAGLAFLLPIASLVAPAAASDNDQSLQSISGSSQRSISGSSQRSISGSSQRSISGSSQRSISGSSQRSISGSSQRSISGSSQRSISGSSQRSISGSSQRSISGSSQR